MDPFIFFNRKYLHKNKFIPGVFLYNESNMYQHYSLYDIYHLMIINFENDAEKLYKLIQLLLNKKKIYLDIPIPMNEIEIIKKLDIKIKKLRDIMNKNLLEIVKYFEHLRKDNNCSAFNTSICIGTYNNQWNWDIKTKI